MNDILHEDPNVNAARKKWLHYLREPGRKKHYKRLVSYRETDRRCCLGHACHVFGAELGSTGLDYLNFGYYEKSGDINISGLPSYLCKVLDILSNGEFVSPLNINDILIPSLMRLNDGTDLNMSQIADIIEEQMKANNLEYYRSKLNVNLKNTNKLTAEEINGDQQ